MPKVFEKLNLKNHASIVVLGAPETFEAEIATLHGVEVLRDLKLAGDAAFFLAFVTRQKAVDSLAGKIAKKAKGDAIVWFAYPKGSSRKYVSEIHRDRGWQALGDAGFEPVRGVAIDQDWSALRFRRTEFIRSMTRGKDARMSAAGKARD